MIPNQYLSIAAIVISILGLAFAYFKWISGIRKEISDLALSLEGRLTRVETKTELFWNSVGPALLNLLKQPIHFRKDELLEKLFEKKEVLSNEELIELRTMLKCELPEMLEKKEDKSLAYTLAMAFIDQVLYDRQQGIQK